MKFAIDHIDAHADLGMGDASWKYIFQELLPFPVEERFYHIKKGGWSGLTEGNFLTYAIACRLVLSLNYIVPIKWANDVSTYIMKNYDLESQAIQLKQYDKSIDGIFKSTRNNKNPCYQL